MRRHNWHADIGLHLGKVSVDITLTAADWKPHLTAKDGLLTLDLGPLGLIVNWS